jgi:hypothetical protein
MNENRIALDGALETLGESVRTAFYYSLRERHGIIIDDEYCSSEKNVHEALEFIFKDGAKLVITLMDHCLEHDIRTPQDVP